MREERRKNTSNRLISKKFQTTVEILPESRKEKNMCGLSLGGIIVNMCVCELLQTEHIIYS